MKYYPKRPVKSFQDLEVYQKTLGLAVEIVKKISTDNKLAKMALSIPRLIATAHSVRFGDSERAISSLEQAMLNCNLTIYYLEVYRDLINPRLKEKIEPEYFEEQIKEYLRVRGRIMRLQRSWMKFMKLKKEER